MNLSNKSDEFRRAIVMDEQGLRFLCVSAAKCEQDTKLMSNLVIILTLTSWLVICDLKNLKEPNSIVDWL